MADRKAFWREHVEAWQRAGGTQQAYCRSAGLDPAQFSAWKRRLQREAVTEALPVAAREQPAALMPVRCAPEGGGARDAGVRVELPGGVCLALSAQFDAEALARAVQALS